MLAVDPAYQRRLRQNVAVRNRTGFQMGALRHLLNEWDFIGVRELSADDDEYDCLVGPLMDRLIAGADADDVAVFLREQIGGHFGLQPTDIDIAAFAARAVAWRHGDRSRFE